PLGRRQRLPAWMRADQTPRPSRRRCTARFHHAYSFSAIRNSEYPAAKNAAIWGQFTPANHDTRKPPAATPLAVSHAGLSRIILDLAGIPASTGEPARALRHDAPPVRCVFKAGAVAAGQPAAP